MAIFFPPVPPVFTGGAQPYGEPPLTPATEAVPANNPPFANQGRSPAIIALVTAVWQPDPWVYSFEGGRQPFQSHQLPPSIAGVPVNNPPFTYPERDPAHIVANAIYQWQPASWQFDFTGGRQPYDQRKLNSAITAITVNNPPFTYPGRDPSHIVANEIYQWQPSSWPYAFTGQRQPYDQRKLNPAITAVPGNNPPFRTPEQSPVTLSIKSTEWTPDPWIYSPPGSSQPYAPSRLNPVTLDVEIDNPPFQYPGRWSGLVNVEYQWQPDPWPAIFMGGREPYSFRQLTPSPNALPTHYQSLRNVIVRARYLQVPSAGGYAQRTFDPADPGESQFYGFDMTNALMGTTIASATVALTVEEGADPSPGSHLVGPVVISGSIVKNRIANLVAGNTYSLEFVVVIGSGDILTVYAHIPCEDIY